MSAYIERTLKNLLAELTQYWPSFISNFSNEVFLQEKTTVIMQLNRGEEVHLQIQLIK